MHRGAVRNLVASLAAFAVIMLAILAVLGFGVGPLELCVWLAVFATGVVLIVRRFREARNAL